MGEISEAARMKACELVKAVGMPNDACAPHGPYAGLLVVAFARYIQAVSDAAKDACKDFHPIGRPCEPLAPFILPEPVDPLAEEFNAAVTEAVIDCQPHGKLADALTAALAKRGLEIRPVQS